MHNSKLQPQDTHCLLLFQHVPNNASPFTKIFKETSTRTADMNAVWCKALVFDFCITSSLSRISFSSFNYLLLQFSFAGNALPMCQSRCERQRGCPASRCKRRTFRRCATQTRPGANQTPPYWVRYCNRRQAFFCKDTSEWHSRR